MKRKTTLVGDGIENPSNALTLLHAAEMFGATCQFRDTKGLSRSEELVKFSDKPFPATTTEELQSVFSRIVALDNLPGAAEVYHFHPQKDFALLLGNERRGLSHESRKLATDAVEIPMISKQINCLNVAAAAAVALYYMSHVRVGPMSKRRNPASRRPELLLFGPGDHIELGSTIRSATAFGWKHAFIEDQNEIWFGCNRVVRSEGRAAARRGRNSIRLIPCSTETNYQFPEVIVMNTSRLGTPLSKAQLARGKQQLIVIPDEQHINVKDEVWTRLGQKVQFVYLNVPETKFTYHYRLVATIVLAEISRQVGRSVSKIRRSKQEFPFYDRTLEMITEEVGEEIYLEELLNY